MGEEASLTFAYFVKACASQYPIVQPLAGHSLMPEQAYENYANVARCTFETHYGKPYWVPQLIDDVDLCGRTLGAGFRLPSSESLSKFNPEHREILYQALKGVPFGAGYNSLLMFARDERNKLTLLDLTPPKARTTPADRLQGERKSSFQLPRVSLRCVREVRSLPVTDMPAVSPRAASCGAILGSMAGGKGGKGAAPRPSKAEPPTPIDPAVLRLIAHAQGVHDNPDSFNPKVTLREVQKALAAAKKSYQANARSSVQMVELMQRALLLRQELENANLPASERAARLDELRQINTSLPAASAQRRPLQDGRLAWALGVITELTRKRYARAYSEYKHWVAIGKPPPSSGRPLAAVEQEARELHKLQQKVDEITGGNTSRRLVLPPKSSFKK
jgi:hypothetical protein